MNLHLLPLLALLVSFGCSMPASPDPDMGDEDISPDRCAPPALPSTPGDLTLGLAGAPVSLFGPADRPTFGAAYAALVAAGFDHYMPIFITQEIDGVARGTAHFNYFLPSALTGTPPAAACEGEHNAYAAMKGTGLQTLFPGFILLPSTPPDQPISPDALRQNIALMRSTCWQDGNEDVLGAIQSYDEPSLFSVIHGFLKQPALLMENVTVASKIFQESFPTLPVASV